MEFRVDKVTNPNIPSRYERITKYNKLTNSKNYQHSRIIVKTNVPEDHN